jgi:pimeloyl-ACP methyl ester carboxylesterase
MQPREHTIPYLLGPAFYRMSVFAWGDPHAQPVVCVHGLTRNAHDFDILAAYLAEHFYVLCPDLPGRGGSDWLPDGTLYAPPSYVQALSHLLAFIDRPVHWVGTSLGGICGMVVAATPGHPIRRMVLNDIGPFVPKEALGRIAEYVGTIPEFADEHDLENYLRRVHAPFGRLTDSQWAAMAAHGGRRLPNGRLTLHYDPKIADPLRASEPRDLDLSAFWDRITIPMLTLRGECSDLLLPETLERMAEKSTTHVVAGAGHAPAMMDEATMAVAARFLRKEDVLF